MNGEPTYHTARRRLETERQPYDRDTVSSLLSDGWGVYAIWSGPYECLYVGKSAEGESVKQRLLHHLSRREPNRDLRRALHLNRDHAEFAVCLTDSLEWATELEDRLIKYYQPAHNRNRLG